MTDRPEQDAVPPEEKPVSGKVVFNATQLTVHFHEDEGLRKCNMEEAARAYLSAEFLAIDFGYSLGNAEVIVDSEL